MSDFFATPISQARHPAVREARELRANAATRRQRGAFVAEGVNVVDAALDARVRLRRVLVSPRLRREPRGARLLSRLRASRVELLAIKDTLMDRIADTRTPQGVVAVIEGPGRRRLPPVRDGRPLVVAWHVQDPGNLGAILRSADALGAAGVLVAGGGADPYHPRAVRAAAGALFRLRPAAPTDDDPEALAAQLRAAGFRLVAAVPHGGTDPIRFRWEGGWALLLGGEGGGLPSALSAMAERSLSISMQTTSESLAVPAAAAILLHEAQSARARRRKVSGRQHSRPADRPRPSRRSRSSRRGGREEA